MSDLISRQAAIEAIEQMQMPIMRSEFPEEQFVFTGMSEALQAIKDLPSAQPTLYGYDIKHLELIAYVLRKENLPPEKITEMLMDIGRIVAMVRDEFEETLRKAVERCTI